jgi:hypothetical protein
MAKAKYISFTNWTKETFEGRWDGEIIEVKPGKSITVQEGMATTLAHQLAQKHLVSEGRQEEIQPKQRAYLDIVDKALTGEEQEVNEALAEASVKSTAKKAEEDEEVFEGL